MKPIHLLILLQWQDQEIAITLTRLPRAPVRSIVEEVCQRQGLSTEDHSWLVLFNGLLLPLDHTLEEALPGIAEQRGIVLFLTVQITGQPDILLPDLSGIELADEEDVEEDFAEDFAADIDEEADEEADEDSTAGAMPPPTPAPMPPPGAPAPAAPPVPGSMWRDDETLDRMAPPRRTAPPRRSAAPAAAMRSVGAAPAQAAPQKEQRQATVRYYHRMNPERTYPLLVVLSKKMIREVVKKAVTQARSQRFEVEVDIPAEIEPVLPGCDCYPPRRHLSLKTPEASATFWVVPRVLGALSQPHVVIRQAGKELAEVPLQIKVVKQTAAVVAGGMSLFVPFVSTLMQHYRVDFASQLADGFSLYAQAGHLLLRSLRPEVLGAMLLLATLGLYLWKRPRSREVFWDIEALTPDEQLELARQALRQNESEKAEQLMSELVQDAPTFQAGWLCLGEVHHGRGDHATALRHYEKALELGKAGQSDYLRAAECAARLGDDQRASALLERAERELPLRSATGTLLYNLSCCAARLGRHEQAMRYLTRAAGTGFGNRQRFEQEPDLQPLRGRPDFRKLLMSLKE